MLAYILALAVGFGSFSLYLSAFLFPEVYRKYDLLWSGLGLFYALVLWVCAGRITGSLLLGQMASVALLGGLGWQTLNLRFAQIPIEQRIQLQGDSLQDAIRGKLMQLQTAFEDGSWRPYIAVVVDRLPAQIADTARTLQGWIEALISTTLISTNLKPQESSIEQNSPSKISDVLSDVTEEIHVGEEYGGGYDREVDRPIAPMPLVDPPAPDDAIDFAAEWDDLDPEAHPELETIDDIGWDFQADPHQGQEAAPQTRPKTSE